MTIQQKILNNFNYLNKEHMDFYDIKRGVVITVYANLASINQNLNNDTSLDKFYREISDESKRRIIQQLVEEKLELLGL